MLSVSLIFHLFTFFFSPPPDDPEVLKLHYILKQDGKKVGDIYAIRTTKEDQIFYEIQNSMTVKILVMQDIQYQSKASYQDGQLQSSISKSFLNKKLHNTCTTTWKGNQYEVKRDKVLNVLKRKVIYSGVMLYFNEPKGINIVYSEMTGQDNAMRKTVEHQYQLTDSKTKKQNKYWYKNGLLDHAFINHILVDLEVVRAE